MYSKGPVGRPAKPAAKAKKKRRAYASDSDEVCTMCPCVLDSAAMCCANSPRLVFVLLSLLVVKLAADCGFLKLITPFHRILSRQGDPTSCSTMRDGKCGTICMYSSIGTLQFNLLSRLDDPTRLPFSTMIVPSLFLSSLLNSFPSRGLSTLLRTRGVLGT